MSKLIVLKLFGLLLFSGVCTAQDSLQYYPKEKEYLHLFNEFKNYLITSIEKDVDISDTATIKHILLNYVVSDSPLDSLDKTHFRVKEVPINRMKELVSDFRGFYQYFLERKKLEMAQHLSAQPLRLSNDKCMYQKLTPFQRENTFVYFDDRYPDKELGYLLFLPRIKNIITAPRIWSWTLIFQSGNWMFKSPMGELGMEHFLSEGVKAPKPENMIGN